MLWGGLIQIWASTDYFIQVFTLAILWYFMENLKKIIMDANSFILKNHGSNAAVLYTLF